MSELEYKHSIKEAIEAVEKGFVVKHRDCDTYSHDIEEMLSDITIISDSQDSKENWAIKKPKKKITLYRVTTQSQEDGIIYEGIFSSENPNDQVGEYYLSLIHI